MKVYIVTYCYYSDENEPTRVGVYSSLEKAREAADPFVTEAMYCNIEEVEVQ